MGSYEEINATGFNISEILDSYNKALTSKGEETAKFKDEIKTKKTKDVEIKDIKIEEKKES